MLYHEKIPLNFTICFNNTLVLSKGVMLLMNFHKLFKTTFGAKSF